MERYKKEKYAALASNEQHHLAVAAMEATGAFGHGLRELIQQAALLTNMLEFDDATMDQRTWASASFTQYWTQRISCAFWRGTAHMLKANADALNNYQRHGAGHGPQFPTASADEDREFEDDGPSQQDGTEGPLPART